MPWPMRFGPPPRMMTFFCVATASPRRRRASERRLIGRIHVGRGRGEFGGAGVDALEDRPDAERVAARLHLVLGGPVSAASRASEKPMALSRRSVAGRRPAGRLL